MGDSAQNFGGQPSRKMPDEGINAKILRLEAQRVNLLYLLDNAQLREEVRIWFKALLVDVEGKLEKLPDETGQACIRYNRSNA